VASAPGSQRAANARSAPSASDSHAAPAPNASAPAISSRRWPTRAAIRPDTIEVGITSSGPGAAAIPACASE
jgi:hypothetical protein